MIYLIGSLRNPRVLDVSKALRAEGFDVFEDWYSAGKIADDCWKGYEEARGHSYIEALQGYAAKHVFAFDKFHISRANAVVLVAPAGKSGHLELGWALGQGKKGYYLLEPDNDRWDVMLQFCDGVADSIEMLLTMLPA